jgi:hypothetical protein
LNRDMYWQNASSYTEEPVSKSATMASSSFTLNPDTEYVIDGVSKLLYVYGSASSTGHYSINRGDYLSSTSTYPAIYRWKFKPVPNQVNTYMIQGANGTYMDETGRAKVTSLPTLAFAWEIALQSGTYILRSRQTSQYLNIGTPFISVGSSTSYKFSIKTVPVPVVVPDSDYFLPDTNYEFRYGAYKVYASGASVYQSSTTTTNPARFRFVSTGEPNTYKIYRVVNGSNAYLYKASSVYPYDIKSSTTAGGLSSAVWVAIKTGTGQYRIVNKSVSRHMSMASGYFRISGLMSLNIVKV